MSVERVTDVQIFTEGYKSVILWFVSGYGLMDFINWHGSPVGNAITSKK